MKTFKLASFQFALALSIMIASCDNRSKTEKALDDFSESTKEAGKDIQEAGEEAGKETKKETKKSKKKLKEIFK
jgi:hypothetical protein